MTGRLLVLEMDADAVSVVDPRTGTVVETVETAFNPHEVVVTPDGSKAYVACALGDEVDVLDTDTWEVTERLTHDTFDFPHGWALAGEHLYLAGTRSNRVYVVDWRADEIVDHFPVDGELTHMIEVTADGSTGYVANIGSDSVSVLDLDAREQVGGFDVGAGPEGIGLHPDEEHLYVANQDDDDLHVVDVTTEDYETVVELPLDRTPVRVVFSPDGEYALVANREGGTLSVVDPAFERGDRTVPWEVKRIRVGLWAGGIAFEPGGERAYVANNKTNDVSVVDMGSLEEIRRIDAVAHPDGIAYLER